MKEDNLCACLGEQHPRQREAPVQRPCGSTVPSIFEEQQRSQCGWHRVSKGECSCGVWEQRRVKDDDNVFNLHSWYLRFFYVWGGKTDGGAGKKTSGKEELNTRSSLKFKTVPFCLGPRKLSLTDNFLDTWVGQVMHPRAEDSAPVAPLSQNEFFIHLPVASLQVFIYWLESVAGATCHLLHFILGRVPCSTGQLDLTFTPSAALNSSETVLIPQKCLLCSLPTLWQLLR